MTRANCQARTPFDDELSRAHINFDRVYNGVREGWKERAGGVGRWFDRVDKNHAEGTVVLPSLDNFFDTNEQRM